MVRTLELNGGMCFLLFTYETMELHLRIWTLALERLQLVVYRVPVCCKSLELYRLEMGCAILSAFIFVCDWGIKMTQVLSLDLYKERDVLKAVFGFPASKNLNY